MRLDLGPLRLDLLADGLFELRPETFVKIGKSRSRIKVGFNALLVRGEGKTVLIDPGTGDKERTAQVRDYKMEWPRRVLPALRTLDVPLDQIDLVILTHLHWDHCGAATSTSAGGQVVPTFPRARYILQRRELDSARRALAARDDGYLAADFEPLVDQGRVDLIDTDEHRVFPWLTLHWTGGHSPGHQIARLGYPEGLRATYFSDLVPTAAQLPLDSGMSYDSIPGELRDSKLKFLTLAARDGDLAIFVHAPRNRTGYISEISPGDFRLIPPDRR